MPVTEGDRLSQMGQVFLNMLVSQEEMAQPPQEKRARMEDAPRSQQRRRQARRPSPMRSETTRSTSSTRDEDPMPVTKLCRLMGQLLIRHEDSLNSVSMQDSFVMFFQRGNSGAVPLLLRAANQWRDLPPDQTQMPLRSYLLQAILNELVSRFQKLHHQLEDPGTKAAAVKSLTVLEDLSFPYLMWHAQQQKLVVSQTASISWTTMESHLGLLQQAFQEPSNCIRFFAMASAQSKADVVPWKLQISLRNDSLSSVMRQLTGSSLWHLMGARMKQHGLQRSKIAQDIQDILHPRKGRQ